MPSQTLRKAGALVPTPVVTLAAESKPYTISNRDSGSETMRLYLQSPG